MELTVVSFFFLFSMLCPSSLVFHWLWWKCCLGYSPVQLLEHIFSEVNPVCQEIRLDKYRVDAKHIMDVKQCLFWYFASYISTLSCWSRNHVKAFDFIDLNLFMDFCKAFDNVMIIEKPLTITIYRFILRLLMCFYAKTLWCHAIGCMYDASLLSINNCHYNWQFFC